MKTLKVIIGYAALARFYAGALGEIVEDGYVRRLPIVTPYAYTPVHQVYLWNRKKVVILETKHRRYEVIEVPTEYQVWANDDSALEDFKRHTKKGV